MPKEQRKLWLICVRLDLLWKSAPALPTRPAMKRDSSGLARPRNSLVCAFLTPQKSYSSDSLKGCLELRSDGAAQRAAYLHVPLIFRVSVGRFTYRDRKVARQTQMEWAIRARSPGTEGVSDSTSSCAPMARQSRSPEGRRKQMSRSICRQALWSSNLQTAVEGLDLRVTPGDPESEPRRQHTHEENLGDPYEPSSPEPQGPRSPPYKRLDARPSSTAHRRALPPLRLDVRTETGKL